MDSPVDRRSWVPAALAVFAVGWGANQFAPLLHLYRAEQGLSQSGVTAVFSVYIVGLLPTLVVSVVWQIELGYFVERDGGGSIRVRGRCASSCRRWVCSSTRFLSNRTRLCTAKRHGQHSGCVCCSRRWARYAQLSCLSAAPGLGRRRSTR